MKKYIKILSIVAATFSIVSCSDDALEATATTRKAVDDIKNVRDLSAVIRGALDRFSNDAYYGRSFIIYGDLYADNTYANGSSGRYLSIGSGQLIPRDGYISDTWDLIYKVVSSANLVISRELNVPSSDLAKYNNLKAQAYLYRALAHFDALRYWGQQNVGSGGKKALGIPYVKTFHPEGKNIEVSRSTVEENIKDLYADLDKAVELFGNDNSAPIFYGNKWSAKALKARVALYFKDYDEVLKNANDIIGSGNYSVPDAEAFVKSWKSSLSSNWLFGIPYTESDELGFDSVSNMYLNSSYGDVVIRPGNLENLFDKTDVRGQSQMIGRDMPNEQGEKWNRNIGKYPRVNPSIYTLPVIRYEEVIFDKIEALLYTNKKADALKLFNEQIAANRKETPLKDLNKEILINEWRKEFYFEGMRFTTLTRNGLGIDISGDLGRKVPYGDTSLAFPIPTWDMNNNPNIEQNKGY
ncbi:RagB/SusD family nutrient uptake outer membrane protein [Ornithobacterium rhinotracheale]|uniref:RagB/SusD family nutrient uptake outer membrane protein n=1 Tax=Ornithobacterium rhinotracheale TaxID=28251 RepID=UPI001FF65FB9|nr:RagB/SusD family nutrient uptake outer membrane protein [Ornithobacterium rhinotracheale]MCK0199913.1 RagB/SusD family nutrient uptake outer membrane protein [Ornithobacterium rhinotracheale]